MCVEALLEACRFSPFDRHFSEEALGDLTGAVRLTEQAADDGDTHRLAEAVTLLAAALSHVPRCKAVHLPVAARGSHHRSHPWVALERLETITTQMIGLSLRKWELKRVRRVAQGALAEAASVGLLECNVYDAWVPGMVSGSGWTTAVCATPLGIMRARQAAQVAASPVSGSGDVVPPAPRPMRPAPEAPQEPTVVLGEPGRPCRVLGRVKKPLSDAEYAVVAALRQAGPAGLAKDALEAVRSSARRILRKLGDNDDDWDQVIMLPQRPNCRYRIKF